MILNIAGCIKRSRVNGVGERFVLWVQGCPHSCPGCFNPSMQPFTEKTLVSVEYMAKIILCIQGICGVTFSGGEPFFQAAPLAALSGMIRKNGLNVITYTGYTMEEIRKAGNPEWNALISETDLLIDGLYIEELKGDFYLRGSSNQTLRFLTDRLKHHPDLENKRGSEAEAIITPQGEVCFTGIWKG